MKERIHLREKGKKTMSVYETGNDESDLIGSNSRKENDGSSATKTERGVTISYVDLPAKRTP